MKQKYLTLVNWIWMSLNFVALVLLLTFFLVNELQYTASALTIVTTIARAVNVLAFLLILAVFNCIWLIYWRWGKREHVPLTHHFVVSLSFVGFFSLLNIAMMVGIPVAEQASLFPPYLIHNGRMIIDTPFHLASWATYFQSHQPTVLISLLLGQEPSVFFTYSTGENAQNVLNVDLTNLMHSTHTIQVFQWNPGDHTLQFVRQLTIHFSCHFATTLLPNQSTNCLNYQVVCWGESLHSRTTINAQMNLI